MPSAYVTVLDAGQYGDEADMGSYESEFKFKKLLMVHGMLGWMIISQ